MSKLTLKVKEESKRWEDTEVFVTIFASVAEGYKIAQDFANDYGAEVRMEIDDFGNGHYFRPQVKRKSLAPSPGSISHGTLNPVHLWESFRLYLPESELRTEGDTLHAELTKYEQDWETEQEIQWELNDLVHEAMEYLEFIAPDGYYFGAHPGDGSDYGFWEIEELPLSLA